MKPVLLLFLLVSLMFIPAVSADEEFGALFSFNSCPTSTNARFYSTLFFMLGMFFWLIGEMKNAMIIGLLGGLLIMFIGMVWAGCSLLFGSFIVLFGFLAMVKAFLGGGVSSGS